MIKEFFDSRAEEWDRLVKHNNGKIKWILSLFKIEQNCKVLDVGCGTGVLENFLPYYSNSITAIDLSEKMIEKAKEKFFNKSIKFIACDLFDIKEKFDLVILYSIYPHIFNKQGLAQKLFEILNENGQFIIFHSDGKNTINNMHNIKASKISVKLKPVSEEKIYFEKFFKIDKTIDDDDYFLLSGHKLKKIMD